ncbi:TetR/AcrR family transcriptional regulator [Microbacterium saperdae]|uniref:TetR family transcriptional regulator n=1 Tax=Microbacterium saperdae TaxID=69368 RepID=A0A543BL42_9MICO|nr:TetR/AcrR family transcriptional regulator [Microbacterium saperdae]TQL85560.1 TetR family transcriptional regulator [Microbacterium saperdae]GGM62818.1 transcriptional regulator [Microbacterium saperdae]
MARQGKYAKGAARREEILAATTRILADDGYRNLSLRYIARDLGIEPAHILYYFDSREELLQKVLERWDQGNPGIMLIEPGEILDRYVEAVGSNLAIPGIVHLYLIFAAEAVHPDHAAHDYFRQRFRAVCELLTRGLEYEMSTGKLRDDIDVTIEAQKLIALADGLQLQALSDPSLNPSTMIAGAIASLRTHVSDPDASKAVGASRGTV